MCAKPYAVELGLPQAFSIHCATRMEFCVAQWMLFVPAAFFNFGFSPLWLRVPFNASVSFVWTMILSSRRGSGAGGRPPDAQ